MIALYPMLVSNTISRNVIPGIAKVIENYLLVYHLEDIMNDARSQKKVHMKKVGKKLVQMESEDTEIHSLVSHLVEEIELEQSQIYSQTGPGTKTKPASSSQPFTYVSGPPDPKEEKEKDKGKDASVKLQPFNLQQLSLEPTWMKADKIDKNGNRYSAVVGVKVVPYAVKSDAKLSNLLMYDSQLNKLQQLVILVGRKIEGWFYKIWQKMWKVATLGLGGNEPGSVTGDPRVDILLQRNILSKQSARRIFAVVNQVDLSDDFTSSSSILLKLKRLGWGSLIVADDVNRRASFCMEELRGLCSILPYTMLYQTMSQAKVYEDLEDAKRSASSIFKTRRVKFNKLIGEQIAHEKSEKFKRENIPFGEVDLINEIYLLDENLGSFIKKMNPAMLKKIIPSMIKGKANIPNVPQDKLVRAGMKADPNFKKSYEFSRKVLSNSAPGVNPDMINKVSLMIAFTSVAQKGKDVMQATKDVLMKFVKLFRKTRDASKSKVKMPPEHYVETAFGAAALTFGLVVISQIWGIVSGIRSWIVALFKDTPVNPTSLTQGANEIGGAASGWFEGIKEFGSTALPNTLWTAVIIIALFQLITGFIRGLKGK